MQFIPFKSLLSRRLVPDKAPIPSKEFGICKHQEHSLMKTDQNMSTSESVYATLERKCCVSGNTSQIKGKVKQTRHHHCYLAANNAIYEHVQINSNYYFCWTSSSQLLGKHHIHPPTARNAPWTECQLDDQPLVVLELGCGPCLPVECGHLLAIPPMALIRHTKYCCKL